MDFTSDTVIYKYMVLRETPKILGLLFPNPKEMQLVIVDLPTGWPTQVKYLQQCFTCLAYKKNSINFSFYFYNYEERRVLACIEHAFKFYVMSF